MITTLHRRSLSSLFVGIVVPTFSLTAASAVTERSLHPVVIPIPIIEAVGFNQVATRDVPLPDPLPLEGISMVWFDHFRFTLERPVAGGKDMVHFTISLLDDGREIVSVGGSNIWTRCHSFGAIKRYDLAIPSQTQAVLDTLRLSLWTTQEEPGGEVPTAVARGFNGEEVLRLYFARGPLSIHEVRTYGELAPQTIDGPGETPWSEPVIFNPAVPCERLKFVRFSSFGFGVRGCTRPAATSVLKLFLDDGSLLLLDDALCPSAEEPVDGYVCTHHMLLLNTEARIRIRDRQIRHWCWKIVNAGSNEITIRPRDETLCYFIYDDSDFVPFRRGDANADNTVDIADAIFILSYLFASGPSPTCLDAADANDDGAVDIADAIAVLSHLFANAGVLPEPFEECGFDHTVDDLDCGAFLPCDRS